MIIIDEDENDDEDEDEEDEDEEDEDVVVEMDEIDLNSFLIFLLFAIGDSSRWW